MNAPEEKRLTALENKVEQIEKIASHTSKKVDEVNAKVDRVLSSLSGDGINDGFIADVRRSVSENAKHIKSLEERSFSKKEKEDIMNFITQMKGWKGVFVVVIWLLPTIFLVYNFYKASQ